MASTLEGLEDVLDGEARLCNCRAGVIIDSSLVLWAPMIPKKVGAEMGGAGLIKTHEGEGGEAPGGTPLLGAELPGRMPRAAGAVLGEKAQERIQIQPRSRGASVAPTGAR